MAFDPSPYLTTFDNVLLLSLVDSGDGEQRPMIQALKATGMESLRTPTALRY
jgi:hypothetical protein